MNTECSTTRSNQQESSMTTITKFRTEAGARMFSIDRMQAGFRTCVVQMGAHWEVRVWGAQ